MLAVLHFVSQAKQEGQPVVITSWAEISAIFALGTFVAMIAGIRRYWHSTECHIAGCKKHQWKKVPGTDHVVCRKHLKSITGRSEPTHAEVLEDHKAARQAAARKI